MITKKCFFNSIVSEGMRHWTADIRDFYVNANNKLTTPCYMKISFEQLSPATIIKYSLEQHRSKGFALVEVTSALYGMPEAGRIAQDKLVAILALHGYIEEERSEKMCLFRSTDPNNRTAFIVHTDDFCIKFHDEAEAEKVITLLKDNGYITTVDREGKKFCGTTLSHDLALQRFHISQPGYLSNSLLQRYNFDSSDIPEQQFPDKYVYPTYGQHTPMTTIDNSPPLSTERRDIMQAALGVILFAAIWTRNDLQPTTQRLISELKAATENTWDKFIWFIGYIKRFPDRGITYYSSDMILRVHSDSNFDPKRSTTGGFFDLMRKDDPTFLNGPIHFISSLQPLCAACIAEGEYIAAFINGKAALPIKQTLDAFGYPQPQTPIYCDNKCAVGIATDTNQMKRSRYIDHKFHWIRDRVRLKEFDCIWIDGNQNIADFGTKILSPLSFKTMLPKISQRSSLQVHSARVY
jgi:hypothetical protein